MGGESLRTDEAGQSSASKILGLLDAIAVSSCPVGVSALAIKTGLPKSTTHRLLKTLESHGFVSRSGAKYQLGERILDLAAVARHSLYSRLDEAALETMTWLFDRVGTTVQVGVLKGADVMVLQRITGPDGARLGGGVGCRFPATVSALGKSLLAFSSPDVQSLALRSLARFTPHSVTNPQLLKEQLVEVRKQGYSVENEEVRLGVRCIGAPIGRGGAPVAAISICSTKALNASAYGILIREAASRCSRRL